MKFENKEIKFKNEVPRDHKRELIYERGDEILKFKMKPRVFS